MGPVAGHTKSSEATSVALLPIERERSDAKMMQRCSAEIGWTGALNGTP